MFRLLSAIFIGMWLVVFTTGCWNRRELNELAVVLAVGIDKVDDQYEVTVQVVAPSQMSRNRIGDRAPVVVYSTKALTLFEALRDITTKSSRKLYIAHIHLILFNENVARGGIKRGWIFCCATPKFARSFTLP